MPNKNPFRDSKTNKHKNTNYYYDVFKLPKEKDHNIKKIRDARLNSLKKNKDD